MDYKTVFEVTYKEFNWFFFFSPLIFVAMGVGLLLFNLWLRKKTSTKRVYMILFSSFITGFGLLLFIVPLMVEIPSRSKTKRIFENKEYQVVEGVIENFHPMPHSGHDMESFTVNGVYFEYSDFVIQYGFNNTASHGGPLKENGQQVRLSYITVSGENRILKIELKQENNSKNDSTDFFDTTGRIDSLNLLAIEKTETLTLLSGQSGPDGRCIYFTDSDQDSLLARQVPSLIQWRESNYDMEIKGQYLRKRYFVTFKNQTVWNEYGDLYEDVIVISKMEEVKER